MATQVAVAVVGHRARQHQAQRLAAAVGGRLFLDNGHLGEWSNHQRAWLWVASQGQPWGLVLQDDAQPVNDFRAHLDTGLGSVPDRGLVSLYLGTGYPTQWQQRVRSALARAGTIPWAVGSELLHGVAVAAPTECIPDMIKDDHGLPYDESLGVWARSAGRPVFYTLPSLVDHADQPTLVDHVDGKARTLPRRAHRVGIPRWDRPGLVTL